MTSHRAQLLACSAVVGLLGFLASPAFAAAPGGIHAEEWPLDGQHFRADQVWRLSQGAGITVAVLDTGVDAAHPDLVGQVLPGAGFVGDHTDIGQSDISGDSHGTSIAAIIAGTGKGDGGKGMTGLAPMAKILPIRISLDSAIEPIALAQGIRYAVDHHARIINISNGSPDPYPTLQAAITYALDHNTVVIAAAGNNGRRGNPPEYPACFPGVVNVTGIDSGGIAWPQSESGPTTTLAAPAVNIYSTADNGHYLAGNGTSYAAPYVAATAALIWSAHPHATAGQIVRQLITTATPAGARPHDDHYGYGMLDPLRTLTTPLTTNTGNPLSQPPPSTANAASTGLPTALIAAVAAAVVLAGVGLVLALRRRSRHNHPG
jgi:type VII secretion-associated serine protease mycosin